MLSEPNDLARWLSLSSLHVDDLRLTRRDLDAARLLRGSTWDCAQAAVQQQPLAADTVEQINAAAEHPPLVPRLAPDGGGKRWQRPSARAALSNVARDAIAMLADPASRSRIRQCANADCELIFYDDSRPGRRRWCAANRCGDTLRARAYRARRLPAGR